MDNDKLRKELTQLKYVLHRYQENLWEISDRIYKIENEIMDNEEMEWNKLYNERVANVL